jgi:hypothetical protein
VTSSKGQRKDGGGHFTGEKAQVRLVTSGKDNHPARGKRGDLIVDTSGRLRFWKGNKNWK